MDRALGVDSLGTVNIRSRCKSRPPPGRLARHSQGKGARGKGLCYYTTSLDAWGSQGARPKQKVEEFIVTSEKCHCDRVLQIPGTVAHWTDTPTDPGSTQRVELAVQMVVVSFRGVYSVGTTIT
ncbi:hypothetical protein CHARACLAT_032884, partial [Characodon lateralis]|nr:hypothetical protein [Characodon lateralis]